MSFFNIHIQASVVDFKKDIENTMYPASTIPFNQIIIRLIVDHEPFFHPSSDSENEMKKNSKSFQFILLCESVHNCHQTMQIFQFNILFFSLPAFCIPYIDHFMQTLHIHIIASFQLFPNNLRLVVVVIVVVFFFSLSTQQVNGFIENNLRFLVSIEIKQKGTKTYI